MEATLRALLPRAKNYYYSVRLGQNERYHWQQLQCNVAETFAKVGFTVEIEKRTPHLKLDVFAVGELTPKRGEERVAIECKDLWSRNVGPGDSARFTQAFALLKADRIATIGLIIGVKGFTTSAENLASRHDVSTCRYDELEEWIRNQRETEDGSETRA